MEETSGRSIELIQTDIDLIKTANPNWMRDPVDTGLITALTNEKNREGNPLTVSDVIQIVVQTRQAGKAKATVPKQRHTYVDIFSDSDLEKKEGKSLVEELLSSLSLFTPSNPSITTSDSKDSSPDSSRSSSPSPGSSTANRRSATLSKRKGYILDV